MTTAASYRLKELGVSEILKGLLTVLGAIGVVISAMFLYMSYFVVVFELFAEVGAFEGPRAFEFEAVMRLAFEVPALAVIAISVGRAVEYVTGEPVPVRRLVLYAVGLYTAAWMGWVQLASRGVMGF